MDEQPKKSERKIEEEKPKSKKKVKTSQKEI